MFGYLGKLLDYQGQKSFGYLGKMFSYRWKKSFGYLGQMFGYLGNKRTLDNRSKCLVIAGNQNPP